MDYRTPIFIVCSPLPHVGKTLVARLLVEYFHTDGRRFAAFDINPDDYALAQQVPGHTTIASINDTKGQMVLFDQLVVADETSKVVDLGYACFEQFFTVMHEIGFNTEAHRRSIVPMVLFVAEQDLRSMQAYTAMQERFPNLALVPVLNSGTGAIVAAHTRFRSKYADIPLQIPFLAPALRTRLQRPDLASARTERNAPDGNSELRAWTRRVFLQFRELELRLLLEELKPSLQLRA